MSRRNMIVVLSLALLLAAAGIWLAPSHRAVRSFVLPQDGTRLSFYKATGGTRTQEAIYANDWRDRFARFVPAKYASKLGFKRILWSSPSSSTNDLVVVLKRSEQSPGTTGSNRVIMMPRLKVTVVDDNGLEADYSGLDSAGGKFVAWSFANYPRRSRTIHLRFWDARNPPTGGASLPLLAEMEIPNPAPSTAPPWVPEPQPATRVTNGLEISLLKLETGLTAAEVERRTGDLAAGGLDQTIQLGSGAVVHQRTAGPDGSGEATNARKYSLAHVDIRENGQPSTGWRVREIDAAAATGISPSLQYVSSRKGTNAGYFSFFGVLWPEEPAWKVTFVVDRPIIPPEDVWSITNIPMPWTGDGKGNAVPMETNMSGMRVVFHEVRPAAGSSPGVAPGFRQRVPVPIPPPGSRSPMAPTSNPLASWLLGIAIENYSPDAHLSLALQTDTGPAIPQGDPAVVISASRDGGVPTASYTYNYWMPADAAKLDATLIVTKYHYATFRVKPTLAH